MCVHIVVLSWTSVSSRRVNSYTFHPSMNGHAENNNSWRNFWIFWRTYIKCPVHHQMTRYSRGKIWLCEFGNALLLQAQLYFCLCSVIYFKDSQLKNCLCTSSQAITIRSSFQNNFRNCPFSLILCSTTNFPQCVYKLLAQYLITLN